MRAGRSAGGRGRRSDVRAGCPLRKTTTCRGTIRRCPLDERSSLPQDRRAAAALDGGDGPARLRAMRLSLPELCRGDRSGAETSLTRCVPGGKATSRKLKELLAERRNRRSAGAAAAAPAPASSIAAHSEAAPQAFAPVRGRPQRCSREGADKDTRHVVLEAVERALLPGRRQPRRRRRQQPRARQPRSSSGWAPMAATAVQSPDGSGAR